MTSGGTESLILACKAYRGYAREEKGIVKPNIVMSVRLDNYYVRCVIYISVFIFL